MTAIMTANHSPFSIHDIGSKRWYDLVCEPMMSKSGSINPCNATLGDKLCSRTALVIDNIKILIAASSKYIKQFVDKIKFFKSM